MREKKGEGEWRYLITELIEGKIKLQMEMRKV